MAKSSWVNLNTPNVWGIPNSRRKQEDTEYWQYVNGVVDDVQNLRRDRDTEARFSVLPRAQYEAETKKILQQYIKDTGVLRIKSGGSLNRPSMAQMMDMAYGLNPEKSQLRVVRPSSPSRRASSTNQRLARTRTQRRLALDRQSINDVIRDNNSYINYRNERAPSEMSRSDRIAYNNATQQSVRRNIQEAGLRQHPTRRLSVNQIVDMAYGLKPEKRGEARGLQLSNPKIRNSMMRAARGALRRSPSEDATYNDSPPTVISRPRTYQDAYRLVNATSRRLKDLNPGTPEYNSAFDDYRAALSEEHNLANAPRPATVASPIKPQKSTRPVVDDVKLSDVAQKIKQNLITRGDLPSDASNNDVLNHLSSLSDTQRKRILEPYLPQEMPSRSAKSSASTDVESRSSKSGVSYVPKVSKPKQFARNRTSSRVNLPPVRIVETRNSTVSGTTPKDYRLSTQIKDAGRRVKNSIVAAQLPAKLRTTMRGMPERVIRPIARQVGGMSRRRKTALIGGLALATGLGIGALTKPKQSSSSSGKSSMTKRMSNSVKHTNKYF